MFADGHGLPQDYVEAYKWLTLARFPASENESRDVAAKSRDLAATKMTPAQIDEARKLAHEWMPR